MLMLAHLEGQGGILGGVVAVVSERLLSTHTLNRRVGGLEVLVSESLVYPCVNRRVGGFKASQANQRPGCCVTQACCKKCTEPG